MNVRRAMNSSNDTDVEYGSVCYLCGKHMGDPIGERRLCAKCERSNKEELELEKIQTQDAET